MTKATETEMKDLLARRPHLDMEARKEWAAIWQALYFDQIARRPKLLSFEAQHETTVRREQFYKDFIAKHALKPGASPKGA